MALPGFGMPIGSPGLTSLVYMGSRSNTGTTTIQVPAGADVGDIILLAAKRAGAGSSISAPGGALSLHTMTSGDTNYSQGLFAIICTGPSQTLTMGGAGASQQAMITMAYRPDVVVTSLALVNSTGVISGAAPPDQTALVGSSVPTLLHFAASGQDGSDFGAVVFDDNIPLMQDYVTISSLRTAAKPYVPGSTPSNQTVSMGDWGVNNLSVAIMKVNV